MGCEGGWCLRHGNLALYSQYKLWNGLYSSLLRELCAFGFAVLLSLQDRSIAPHT
jgi:hypothetical protein